MSQSTIPVYKIDDLALESGTSVEIRRLEEAFAQGRRNVSLQHRHDFFEIAWVSGGRGMLDLDFVRYQLVPPTLALFAPSQVHAWSAEAPFQGFILRFTNAFWHRTEANLAHLPLFAPLNNRPVHSNVQEAERFDDLFQRIEREYVAKQADFEIAIHAYLRILLVEIVRLGSGTASTHIPSPATMLARQFLLLVETRFSSVTSVAQYAALLHVTPSHLNETIRRTLGKTASAVVRDRILLEARRLLRHSNHSIAEIALQLNFEDPSYFGRFFKKYTGVTPGAFRQEP